MGSPLNIRGLPPVSVQSEVRPGSTIGRAGQLPGGGAVNKSFSTFLEAQLNDVNKMQKEGDEAVASMVTGRSHNIHEMMIALDRADVSFRMLTKVRNKAVEAYQEIMRMHI